MKEERLILQGQLATLNQDKFRLAARIQGKLRSVKLSLSMSAVRELHEVDIRSAADELTEAADLRDRLVEVRGKIDAIEAELAD